MKLFPRKVAMLGAAGLFALAGISSVSAAGVGASKPVLASTATQTSKLCSVAVIRHLPVSVIRRVCASQMVVR